MTTRARITAKILLETESVLFRPRDPFILTSGRASPVYIDCRRLIAFPRARAKLMDMLVDTVTEAVGYESIDIVAGGETAGIPFAAWMAERLGLPMAYIRKQSKGFGRNARIEGRVAPGDRVLLVEDLATDGGSKLSFVEAIREAEAHCAHCCVLFHYGIFPAALAGLTAKGVSLHALATWADVVAVAQDSGTFDAKVLDGVRAFLADPVGWSRAHGGKED